MNSSADDLRREPQFDPIRVEGGLRVSLFGLTIGRIRLNLDIMSLDRLGLAITSVISNDDEKLSALSRAELYELAKDAQIGGRSAMSRAELISALGTGSP